MVDVVFRVDASTIIGAGHVMRCLTLATEIVQRGMAVHFICNSLPGHLINKIHTSGFAATLMQHTDNNDCDESVFDWIEDVNQTIDCIHDFDPKLLIVDHYAIDERWHKVIRPYVMSILVIDDLADRTLDCDWLLDQTYQRQKESYEKLTPNHCKYLLGTEYALLRPDFSQWRAQSLSRRDSQNHARKILIAMGGSDAHNLSGQLLGILDRIQWEGNTPQVNLVIGASNPHAALLKKSLSRYSYDVRVLADIPNMAELMAEADLAIGAGGMTSWERCCMGLPALVIVCAHNQAQITEKLNDSGAVVNLGWFENINELALSSKILELIRDNKMLKEMSRNARAISDGTGVKHCVNALGI